MNLKRYRVKNIKEALAFIKRDLGPDALIVSTRQVKEGKGAFGMFGKTMLEVTAAVSEEKKSSAHTKVATGTGLSEEEVINIRRRQSDDPKIQALINFTAEAVDSAGNVSDATLQAFMDAGYSTEAAIEVVAGISVMTFTSFYNHINDTEVDFPTIPKL